MPNLKLTNCTRAPTLPVLSLEPSVASLTGLALALGGPERALGSVSTPGQSEYWGVAAWVGWLRYDCPGVQDDQG